MAAKSSGPVGWGGSSTTDSSSVSWGPPVGWTEPNQPPTPPGMPDGWVPGEDTGGEEEDPIRVFPGAQGPQGPPGERGVDGPAGPAGGRLRKRTRGALSGARVVYADGPDHIELASVGVQAHARAILGVSVQSATAAETEVEVVHAGEYEDDGWSFIPQRVVFLGMNGTLTQTYDDTWPFVLVIGVAISPTKVFINIRLPIFQSGG